MKRILLRTVSVLLALTFALSLAGCADDSADARIYFELNSRPTTVDPQTAQTDVELLLVRNLYEGLLRRDADGELQCGAAENYTVSGLTYTFTLRKGLRWDDGEKLTAQDFVYGIRRALLPETNSPHADRLFCIAGAKEVRNGGNPSKLGVTAKDDRTVEIRLAREDEDFPGVLSNAACMPCSEDFFKKCIGKYGLGKDYVLSNGSYRMKKWNQEDDFGIRLLASEEYDGPFRAKNGGVFFSCDEKKTPLERLTDGDVDAAFLTGNDAAEAERSGCSVTRFQNICWVMTVGKEFDADARAAFALLVDRRVYEESLPDGFAPADSLFPDVLKVKNASGVGISGYDPAAAEERFSRAVLQMEDKKVPPLSLTYADGMREALTAVVGHWQNRLSAFVNIEVCDEPELLLSQLDDRTLQFAVFPIVSENGSLREYLGILGAGGAQDAAAAQKKLLAGDRLIPLAFENTNLVCCDRLTEHPVTLGNGMIDFSFFVRKN